MVVSTQKIKIAFDKDAIWNRVGGRLAVFMDTNCWIDMADAVDETACEVRDRLSDLVAAGRVFCPLSWGILEELSTQSGESLERTSRLMEELSLNAIFIMRTDLYEWELDRSIRRSIAESVDDSLNGLFAPPAAFVGSELSLAWKQPFPLSAEEREQAEAYMKHALSGIGVFELAREMSRSRLRVTPVPYSAIAKKVMETFKGKQKKLFLEEAVNCLHMYVAAPLLRRYPRDVIASWSVQFGPPDDEEAWVLKALVEFPAIHNYIEIMVVADSQPGRKDKYSDFMDNEIMVAPLAYANVFASKDRAIRDILRNRTKILGRTRCQYCDSLDALQRWLTENVV